MLEALLLRDQLASGGTPTSLGPGPTTLLGYYNPYPGYETGLYGELRGDGTEFISTSQLRAMTGNIGTPQAGTAMWMKYVLDGKIIYIPRTTLASNFSWVQLYQQGLVYGVDDNGTYPSGSGVNQKKIISWGGYEFLVRLVSVASTDPATTGAIENTTEWARLMYPIASDVSADECDNKEKWGEYDLSISGVIFGKESTANLLSAIGVYTKTTNRNSGSKASVTANRHWRPVLELIS